jgi:3'-phosphoadenosine 5'-phosphosulfate (PAPS) 3'-phosphatase
MDMSVLCSGFPRTLFRPLPLPSPIVPSVSPSTTTASSATRNSQLATTTTTIRTLGEEPSNNVNKNNGNGTVTVVRTRRHSRSYLERQSAILEVEQASDVDSAVARYCIFLLCVCACYVKLVTLLLSLGKFL